MTDNPKTVEIKVTVANDLVDGAAKAFALRDSDAERRKIWFCESRAGLADRKLLLLDRGIILRLRAIPDDPDDATLKLRAKALPDLPAELDFEVQGDWAGDHRLLSASMVSKVPGKQIREAVASDGDLSQAFSAVQLSYLSDHCDPPIEATALQALGPIQASKWSSILVAGFPHTLRAELWEVPGLRFLEFSIEVSWADAETAQARLHRELTSRGLAVGLDQAPKTTLVLRPLAGTDR